jgi:nucleoside-diphosphate-sugar epimerase
MSIAITGAAGQLGRLVIDDLLSAGIPGTDLIAIARPRPEIGHLDETDRCGHRMRRVYCRSTTRCERTQMLRSYINCRFSNSMSNSQMECPMHVQLDISVRMVEW